MIHYVGVACKLYFDMEYKMSVNVSLCGAELVNVFVKVSYYTH